MKLGVNKCDNSHCGLILFTLGDTSIKVCPVCHGPMKRVGLTELPFAVETGLIDEMSEEQARLLLGR